MIHNNRRSYILLFIAFFGVPAGAVAGAGAGEKIKVAFGDALAPWVMPETNGGIVIDLIEQTLVPLGYEVEKVYLPYARRLKAYDQGLVDVVSDINPNTLEDEQLRGYFSDIAYSYENFAFSLKSRNYAFKNISDLGSKSLLSWQGAITHLGAEYAEMAQNNPAYSEHHNQSLQVKMLFFGRVDVIQMDEQIFEYYRAKIASGGEIDTSPEVDRFALFGRSPNGFLFRSLKVRDDFNAQLKLLKESGQYEIIINQHSK